MDVWDKNKGCYTEAWSLALQRESWKKKNPNLFDWFTKLFSTCFTSYCRYVTVGSVSAPPPRRKIPSVRLQAQTCCSCSSPTLPVSTSAADSCREGRFFANRGLFVSCRCWTIRAWLRRVPPPRPRPTTPHSPRGLLLSEKDQELFQLPPPLFSMEHNFKHCMSEPAAPDSAKAHTHTHTKACARAQVSQFITLKALNAQCHVL